jgi:8-amino-7-oxononanoate synthase
VLNFTSALYLGLQHPSHSLRPWQTLTTGAPAALVETVEAREIGRALAELQGCEAATLGTSTFHLAWDLFGLLAETPINLFMDAGVYPITRWGVQRAAMRGAMVRAFPHHDAAALERDLAVAPRGRKPVIVTDGFCPSCGRVAPLAAYLTLARRRGGLLVADDTQALGILGHSPSVRRPYGCGGGGALRWSGIHAPEILVISSLAKGFGAPVAVLAGSHVWIGKFEEQSLTRVHCSPPSIAVLRAAEEALKRNRLDGDARRERLAELVRRFRRGVKAAGVAIGPGLFPMQAIKSAAGLPLATLHHRLLERGVRTALSRGENGQPRITFLLTARHTPQEIDAAVSAIIAVLAGPETSKKINYEQLLYQ